MARLEAISKQLFYPTQSQAIEAICRHVVIDDRYGNLQGVIFDPCIGEGIAVSRLAQHLGPLWTVKGVELNEQRATAAKNLLDSSNIVNADIRNVVIDGKAHVLFLNPPYDEVNGKRLEIEFVALTASTLTDNGLMILIVPDMFVGEGRYANSMATVLADRDIRNIKVFRYPEPVYSEFKQVVIFGSKHVSGYSYKTKLEIAGILGEISSYSPRSHDPDRDKRKWIWSAEDKEPLHIEKVRDSEPATSLLLNGFTGFEEIFGDPNANSFEMNPLMPMSQEHAALVAAAGMLNGIVIDDRVIRGSTYKVTKTVEKEIGKTDQGDAIREIIEAEVLVARLTMFDLSTGEITSVNNDEHQQDFNELILRYANDFVEAAKRLYPPTYNLSDVMDLSKYRSPQLLKGQDTGLLEPQRHVASAIVKLWRKGAKVATLVGEMGTGKTTTAIAAAAEFILGRKPGCQKVIVVTPAKDDLTRKWAEEANAILKDIPGAKATAVNSISDLIKCMDRPGLDIIIMKETTAKDSSPWKYIPPFETNVYELDHWLNGNLKNEPHSPDIFKDEKYEQAAVKFSTGKTGMIKRHRLRICPDCLTNLLDHGIGEKSTCPECKYPMWTFVHRYSKSNKQMVPKYPLARFLRQHYSNQYVLILDEAHNFKGGDTNRGYATYDLISGAYRAVQMTGTIFGGKASTLFYLLYRTVPAFRDIYDPRDEQSFVNNYGLFEKITKYYPEYSGSRQSGYSIYESNPKERAGMDPGMVSWLLPNTAFMAIRDFDFLMPEYSEHTLFVDPDPELLGRANHYLNDLKDKGVDDWKNNRGKSVLSQWQWARFGVFDRPTTAEEIAGCVYVPPEKDENFIYSKEESLLRLVWQEKQLSRPVLCYIQQINQRDPTPRLIELLKMYGMKGAVLRANVKDRLEFIRKELRWGADIIFTNAALVAEGVNIIETPTIIWYQHDFNVYRMPQANRRPYRFTQDEPVKIIYLAYNKTPQAEAMSYIAQKLAAQQALQGDIKNGLAALETEDDFVSELQDSVSNQMHFESDLSLGDLPLLPEIVKPEVINGKIQLPKMELTEVEFTKMANGQIAFF